MTKAELTQNMAWENFSIQPDSKFGCLLILICKDEHSARSLHKFLSKHLPTIRASLNLETSEYSIHFFFKDTRESLEYKTGKTTVNYPQLRLLGSGMLKGVTTGLMSNNKRLDAFTPILLDNPTHSN